MFRIKWHSLFLLTISLCRAATIQTDNVKSREALSDKFIATTSTESVMDQSRNSQEDINEMEVIMDQCNKTYNIDMTDWQFLNESGTFPDETFMIPKCFVNCVLMMTRVASVDGKFDVARAAEVFAGRRGGIIMEDLEELARGCTEVRREENDCERGYGFLKCLMEMEIEKYETYEPEDNH